ncbi:P-loop NTPase fold protein [Alsobacter sp. KACC 23698]|uniref:P-loop NTPase fold protein n=1 Tax=Alsobacter sp. KACC 23698 TaxID=3149229 RepID=A0AAU7JDS3_9HYPH
MKFKPTAIADINTTDLWSGDNLARKDVSAFFLKLTENSEGPTSIRISAKYGSGKTFLLDRFAIEAINQGHIVIKYNAWENDFVDDAQSSLCATIISELRCAYPDEIDNDKAGLAANIFPVLACSAVGIAPGLGLASTEALKFVKTKIEAIEKARIGITNTRKALESISTKQKILVIVDELDRCRPDFTIKIIECIKHLFAARGVIFFASLNTESLTASATSVHGRELDVRGYCERLFDYTFDLTASDLETFSINSIYSSFGRDRVRDRQVTCAAMGSVIGRTARFYDGSLRDIEKICREIELYDAYFDKKTLNDTYRALTMAMIMSLRHYDRDLLKKFTEYDGNTEVLRFVRMFECEEVNVKHIIAQLFSNRDKLINFMSSNFPGERLPSFHLEDRLSIFDSINGQIRSLFDFNGFRLKT